MSKVKVAFIFSGIIALFLILQFQFLSKESWDTWNLPLTGEVIVLDAGHGGPDGGAEGKGVQEKDVALNIVMYLKDYLQEEGALVILTREDDRDLASDETKGYSNRKSEDLKKRLEIINESDANLYLTIHLNAIASSKWSGAQTFYTPHFKESEDVAKFIQDEIKRNLENTNRYAKPINNVFLLKYADIPGALVEVGFLSNPHERELLKTEEYQKKLAAAIYQGILRFYTEEEAPSQPPI